MEAERQTKKDKKKPRQVSEKNTPFNVAERKSAEAAKVRAENPNIQALYDSFFPGAGRLGGPKFITDKYGNRVRSGMEGK
jgi:hypothetical protein